MKSSFVPATIQPRLARIALSSRRFAGVALLALFAAAAKPAVAAEELSSAPTPAAPLMTEADAIARLEGTKIQMGFNQMPLADVLAALVHGLGVEVRFNDPKAFTDPLSLSVEQSRWQLLRRLAEEYSIEMHWKDGGWDLKRAPAKIVGVTVAYPLQHLTGERADQKAAPLRELLASLAEGEATVKYDAKAGAYEVTTGPRGQALAREYVRIVDAKQTNVKVEVQVRVIFGKSLPTPEPLLSAQELDRLLSEVRQADVTVATKSEWVSASETFEGPSGKRIALPHNSFCDVYVHPFPESRKVGMTFRAEVRQNAGGPAHKLEPDPRAATPTKAPTKPLAKVTKIETGVMLQDGYTTIARWGSSEGDVLIALTTKFVDDVHNRQ